MSEEETLSERGRGNSCSPSSACRHDFSCRHESRSNQHEDLGLYWRELTQRLDEKEWNNYAKLHYPKRYLQTQPANPTGMRTSQSMNELCRGDADQWDLSASQLKLL